MNESITILNTNEKVLSKEIFLIFKRIVDIVLSLIGLILFIPIVLIIKIAYLISGDKNSIFFTQERIGKDGNVFNIYKFRTMIPNADEVLFNTLELDLDLRKEYQINKKLKNDPRITKIGHILRKTSIDELPQLINILKGDMTFIGNRPYLPREVEDMGLYFYDIVKTKPGLSGYWQVNGRSETDFKTRLIMEKYYSNNYNLKLDTEIFFKTFFVVFINKGAK